MKKSRLTTYILYIIGIILSVIYISPYYILIVNAFKTKRELFESTLKFPTGLMLDNFKIAIDKLSFFWFEDLSSFINIFKSSFFNSILVTAFSIVVIMIFTSMGAWMLVRTKSKISTVIFFTFIAAMLVPFQAVMLPLVALAGRLHLQNIQGLVFMYLGFSSSLSIFLYHGFIKGIPVSLEEAAKIDGCTPWGVFWKI
ncbi:MAG: carbohydrate ABC transporter permease, partial [Fusobacteriaceae bacterium]